MRYFYKYSLVLTVIFLLNACATYKTQLKKGVSSIALPNKEIEHTFYLIGDAGNSKIGASTIALQLFKKQLSKASKNSTAIFLGDNVYPKGFVAEQHKNRAFAEHQLIVQTDAVKDFKGQVIFIPGNHDWYSGIKGLHAQEEYIENIIGDGSFLPEKGCPIDKVHVSDDVELIIIDSEWYLTDWDKHPTVNDDCEIRTRERFYEEFESLVKKARGKTTLIAIHHPMFTNGPHGGQYSFTSHLKPIPILGSLKNVIRKTSGISPADIQNSDYNTMIKRLVTLARENDKVIFVSGHEHNLQYLKRDNIAQIISGSGSKNTPTRNISAEFTSSEPGFAILDVYKDGSSYVRFISAKTNEILFQSEVLKAKQKKEISFSESFPDSVKASIYKKNEIDKSKLFKFIWGERYRNYYGVKVMAPTVRLDTLFGGLIPLRKGGGNQTTSLRLINKEGRQYVMRNLRKNAEVYLQAMAFKEQYVMGDFENTITESVLLDFYTGAHPYALLTTSVMSDALNIFHTNPALYYVPKQHALGAYNDEFGDELYVIEEHVGDSQTNVKSFGYTNKIESTDDLVKKLRKDEKYVVDEASYLRARLFDIVIGDWDRHQDQWRWAEFKDEDNDNVNFKPIPRDRDQVFSVMGDGAFMEIATRIIPPLKHMEGFSEEIRNIKGFNLNPFPLDMIILNRTSKEEWKKQVEYIQNKLTPEVVDKALKKLPKEVQDDRVAEIKNKLLARINNLHNTADDYYKVINKVAIIRGTDKDDWFDIERLPEGETKVTAYRIKKREKADVFHQKTYQKEDTKEIWIYGLDDDDVFKIYGVGNNFIKTRIIGGQNNDTYVVENGKKVKIYDYKSKKNKFITNKGRVKLTDDYDTNVYDYSKIKNNTNQFLPTVGYNPDDGVKLGVQNTFTKYGLERNPFTASHVVSGAYYFATAGFELNYNGEFANVLGDWNLVLDSRFTSPNYSVNFFNFGNESKNPNYLNDNSFNKNYNRVKISSMSFNPSLVKTGTYGTKFSIGTSIESIEVEETTGRFINVFYDETEIENTNYFLGVDTEFSYKNQDNKAFPTMGMQLSIQGGYKTSLEKSTGFGYLKPSLSFNYQLVPSGQLVLATKFKGSIIFGDNFEFYQASSIGGADGLRGYRNQRFTGKSSFYQSTDVRLNLRKVRTKFLPLYLGVYGGFDYGRVWLDDEESEKWHNSYGGGIFANASDVVTLQVSLFTATERIRFAFGVGFTF